MSKKSLKKEMLEMLKSDMVGMKKDKKDLFDGKMPEKMDKITVMADSKEGLMEGLSKAEQIMKAKLGSKKDSKCSTCDASPCECEESEE